MKKHFITLVIITTVFIQVLKSQNSTFTEDIKLTRGNNAWIFHAPPYNKSPLILAPYNSDIKDWNWWNQFIFDNEGKFTTGYLHIRPQNSSTTEGGELLLQGSSGYSDVYLDNNSGHFRVFDSSVRLISKPGGHLQITGSMAINGAELQLGLSDGRSVGNIPYQRALVHHWDNSDMLVINYDGDFEGGTIVHGNKFIVANNVGIGTINPDERLTVKGKIHAEEVKVDLQVPADYVFQKYYTGNSTLKSDYRIPTLQEVEEYTKKYHHLPSIPSAKEIQEKGLELGEMSNLLLQKIEELTLYIIEQQKQIEQQQKQIDKLKQN